MRTFGPQFDAPEVVMEKHTSVKTAADCSGYSIQYLRRLLRSGRLEGVKIGQVWLIKTDSLEAYVRLRKMMQDRRHARRRLWLIRVKARRNDAADLVNHDPRSRGACSLNRFVA